MQLFLHKSGELTQTHFYNGTRLNFSEFESFHQAADCIIWCLSSTNYSDYFVNVVRSNNQTFEDMCTFFRFAKFVLCTTNYYVVTVFNEVLNQLLQVQCAWAKFLVLTIRYKCYVVHTKRSLKLRHLIKLVQYHACVGIALNVDNDAHTFAVGFVIGIRNTFDFLFGHQITDALDEFGLVYAIRNFGNNNLVVVLSGFNFSTSTHHYTSSTCEVGFAHTTHTIYISTSWEIGSFYVVHQLFDFDIVVVDVSHTSINHFGKVVCRHIGCHTYGNTRRTIYQKIGDACWHNAWFEQRIVEVWSHVHGFLVNIEHHVLAYLLQATFGITHSCCTIAIHRTVVTLSIYKHIAHCPGLSHTNQCSIYRRVTMRVILTQHLTYYSGRFLIRFVRGISQSHHTEQDSSVNRFKTISNIRKCTSHNYRH